MSSSSNIAVGWGVIGAFVIVAFFCGCCARDPWNKWWRRRRRRQRHAAGWESDQQVSLHATATPVAAVAVEMPLTNPHTFSYGLLRLATENFSDSALLGRGASGSVYKAILPDDGSGVAVKRIPQSSRQGAKEFKAEVDIISDLRHRNLVRLKGWCFEESRGEFLLVYEYMPNGSLNQVLFEDQARCTAELNWERRFGIASGIAAALQYLHDECDTVIIHRDIKPANVLLNENYCAKLGDFGLSRQVGQGLTSHTTLPGGTLGYMAPELFSGSAKATRESDVYAFGALLLHLVCGRQAFDSSLTEYDGVLLEWLWDMHSKGKLLEAVDRRLAGGFDSEQAERVLVVGLACCQPDPKARLKIRCAVDVLRGNMPLPSLARPSANPPFYGSSSASSSLNPSTGTMWASSLSLASDLSRYSTSPQALVRA